MALGPRLQLIYSIVWGLMTLCNVQEKDRYQILHTCVRAHYYPERYVMAVVCALPFLEPKREKYVEEREKIDTLSNSMHILIIPILSQYFLCHPCYIPRCLIRKILYVHETLEFLDYFVLFFHYRSRPVECNVRRTNSLVSLFGIFK